MTPHTEREFGLMAHEEVSCVDGLSSKLMEATIAGRLRLARTVQKNPGISRGKQGRDGTLFGNGT